MTVLHIITHDKFTLGYINFMSKFNADKIIFLLKTNEIYNFFTKIKANLAFHKQILCYKGNTFELVLKNNLENNEYEKSKLINSKTLNNQNSIGKIKLSPIRKKFI